MRGGWGVGVFCVFVRVWGGLHVHMYVGGGMCVLYRVLISCNSLLCTDETIGSHSTGSRSTSGRTKLPGTYVIHFKLC